MGYEKLEAFAGAYKEYDEALSWLVDDVDKLRFYIFGGKPDGSYIDSLKVLAQLYNTYKDDLNDENLKEVYRKMMISLSLTHSTTVGLWVTGRSENVNDPNESNAIQRYQIYKELLADDKLAANVFLDLNVEEMRFVMNNIIDDEEIKWLNDYTRKYNSRDPYYYITYTFGYNYFQSKYYDPNEYARWDAKYNLSEYNITYRQGYPKLFVVFEEGGVCGALSKTGSNIWGTYGVPSSVVSQPGHAAYIVYSKNASGDGIWTIYNNISGWAQSGKTEKLNVRMPNGWGSGSYASTWPASYILLAQAALNDFDSYENAEKILLLANVYSNDYEKLEEIYRDALAVENINFDAWLGLVNLYKNTARSESDFYNLAVEITNNLRYYPLPMYDLLRLIEPYMTSSEYVVRFNMLKQNNLTLASKATNNESIQAAAVREVANYLLGNIDTKLASFSFDGDNAGEIVLASRFDDAEVTWEYSLDGKNTWHQTNLHEVKLSDEELASINAENDIAIHIVGASYDTENIYVIDIGTGTLPNNIYNNDLENKLIGVTDSMEWRFADSASWTKFGDALPDLTGIKVVYVRQGATGSNLPSAERSYNFTPDNDNDTRKYIYIEHLGISEVSSEATSNGEYATNAIDGNIYTMWHSSYDGSDKSRYIIIELDEERYLSALEYTPRQSGTNGRIQKAEVYVSMDKETWTKVGDSYNFANSASTKAIEFPESVKAKYIKLVATSNYGDGRSFVSAAMINLFEDITKKEIPTADISYSITTLTNKDVTVSLINPSKNITITNNGGSREYTFTSNGEFTFEYVDDYGNVGKSTAKVTWIDKTAPVGSVSYNKTSQTADSVIATITFNEDVTILNNGGKNTYEFFSNGSFEFIYRDSAGNEGRTSANVDWIIADNKENDQNNAGVNDEANNNEVTDSNKNNNEEKYKTLNKGNITLSILSNLISDNSILEVDKLELTEFLIKELGSNSEYYRIYMTDDGVIVDETGKIKMIVSLDSSKEFLGIYKINSNDDLEKLSYTKLDDNRIELEVEDLGDYVIDYEDEEEVTTSDDNRVTYEESNDNYQLLGIFICIIILGIAIIWIYRKKKYNK